MARLQSRQISQLHLYQVLHTVRVAGQPMSRSQICEMTGLSQAAISNLSRRLIGMGGLIEVGARPSQGGGRREREFVLNPEFAWVVGVTVSSHQVTVSLVDFAGGVRDVSKVALELPALAEDLACVIVEQIRKCLADAEGSVSKRLAGVGVALPGFIDSMRGEVQWSAVLRMDAAPVPFGQLLTDMLDVPVFIENDANMLALAEQWFGDAAGLANIAVVTIEHGLGLGLVLNGELYRGHSGLAAELAHIQVEWDGALCRCGKQGCLETLVNHDALIREGMRLGVLDKNPLPLSFSEIHARFARLIQMARDGNDDARAIFTRHGQRLGLWIGNVINLFAPQMIVLDGGGMMASDLFESTLREVAFQAMLPPHRGKVPLLVKRRGDEAWARGAAALVLQRLDNSASIIESVSRHGVEIEDVGGRTDV